MRLHPAGVLGFALTAVFSVAQEWSLREFCWSAWLAGLVFAWTCVVTAGVHIVFSADRGVELVRSTVPALARFPRPSLFAGLAVGIVLLTLLALRLYSMLFGFYGLFLSVFAEMPPHELFGRNGFINSDFFTPVTYLLTHYWPMVLSTLVAAAPDVLGGNPWKRVVIPMGSEVLRIHAMVIALPMVSLAAWAIFGASYERVAVVLLLALFFLLPHGGPRRSSRLPEIQLQDAP